MILLLLGCVAAAVLVSAVGWYVMRLRNAGEPPGTFRRDFSGKNARAIDSIRLGYNSFYIAGAAGGKIYLANTTAPLLQWRVDTSFRDTARVQLGRSSRAWPLDAKQVVSASSAYLLNRAGNFLIRASVQEDTAVRFLRVGRLVADFGPVGSMQDLVIRTLDSVGGYTLARYSEGAGLERPPEPNLEKRVDGRFCVDGMLSFDRETQRIVYAYYYRNEFLVMDAMLHVLMRARTIDNRVYEPIKTGSYGRVRTLLNQPVMVNRHLFTGDTAVFIHSKARSESESGSQFVSYDVIDRYHLLTGAYEYSFRIPNPARRKLRSVCFHRGCLYMIYDKQLFRYAFR